MLYIYCRCNFECKILQTASVIPCVPWYFPQISNTPACDPWNAAIFVEKMEQAICDYCLPDCNTTDYAVQVTQAKIE